MLCRTVPHPHRTAPYRACRLADLQPRRLLLAATLDWTATTRPGEGVSDYKEGCSRPESAQGKLLHTLGILHRAPTKILPNYIARSDPKVIRSEPSVFFPLRHLVLDTTPHIPHTAHHSPLTHIDTLTGATPLYPQHSIDRSFQLFRVAPNSTLVHAASPRVVRPKCGIQLHSPD